MKTCIIYSVDSDRQYAQHIECLEKLLPDVCFKYALGEYTNSQKDSIYSSDTFDTAVFVRSYSYLSHYSQIPNTFLWVNPRYNVTVFQNKYIAMDVTLDDESTNSVLKYLVPPTFEKDVSNAMPLDKTKNYAFCSKREIVFLK